MRGWSESIAISYNHTRGVWEMVCLRANCVVPGGWTGEQVSGYRGPASPGTENPSAGDIAYDHWKRCRD